MGLIGGSGQASRKRGKCIFIPSFSDIVPSISSDANTATLEAKEADKACFRSPRASRRISQDARLFGEISDFGIVLCLAKHTAHTSIGGKFIVQNVSFFHKIYSHLWVAVNHVLRIYVSYFSHFCHFLPRLLFLPLLLYISKPKLYPPVEVRGYFIDIYIYTHTPLGAQSLQY